MTNTNIAPTLELAGAGPGPSVIVDYFSIWPHMMWILWLLVAVVAPSFSIFLCIRAWRRHRMGRSSPWALRIILIAVLLTVTTTIAIFLYGLRESLFLVGTTGWGAAEQSVLMVNLAGALMLPLMGCAPTFLCLLCALCLPLGGPRMEVASRSPEAG